MPPETTEGYKVIYTVSTDLGRTTYSLIFFTEAEAMSYAATKNFEGEADPIVEHGWYTDEDWNGLRRISIEIWDEDDLTEEDKALTTRQKQRILDEPV